MSYNTRRSGGKRLRMDQSGYDESSSDYSQQSGYGGDYSQQQQQGYYQGGNAGN